MADCIQNVIKIGCENYGECIIPPLPPEDGNLVGYDDIDVIKHIHHSIPQQMSTFLNLDYNRLVEFLKAYWKWAEMPHTPYFNLKNHLDIHVNVKSDSSKYEVGYRGSGAFDGWA